MKEMFLLGLILCAVFMTCHSAVSEESYEALLASVHNIPLPESDGTQFLVTYVDGKKRTYTRGILDSFTDSIVGAYTSVANSLGFEVSYKTSSGTEVEVKGVILNKGTENEELVEMGAYSYNVGETIVTNMWTAGREGFRNKVVFRNRAVIMPKAIESLLSG